MSIRSLAIQTCLMNIRPSAIQTCLNHLSKKYSHEPLNIVEIGCMFKEDEGLSTLIITKFLSSRDYGGKLVSIDYDNGHIESCKKILKSYNPSLLENIEFFQGNTLDILPRLSATNSKIHFFLIDGGAQPETCLFEFEYAMKNLADNGLILIDDSWELPPSKLYWLPRPFGKATLIFPMLIMNNYMKNRKNIYSNNQYLPIKESIPGSIFIEQLIDIDFSMFEDIPFALLGSQGQMLLVGNNYELLHLIDNQLKHQTIMNFNIFLILWQILLSFKSLRKRMDD